MTDEPTTTTSNKPVAYLYFSKAASRRGGRDRLIRIGAVFVHRSGKGRTHVIDVLPVDREWDGRIVELEPNEDFDSGAEAQA